MAGSFTALDLSRLAAPSVVEALSFEQILEGMVAELRALAPEFDALVESDPAFKLLEVAAYREVNIRQRVNDAARAVMLAYAKGTDLDQIGANYSVGRLLIDVGDPTAVPPVPPTYEGDEDFRRRIQLAPEGYTSAGSRGSYEFHALGAAADVLDAQATSPAPGSVLVYVMSREGDGTASVDLVDAVSGYLSDDKLRPMTDQVTVQSVTVTGYTVNAALTVFPGPDSAVVRQAAEDAVRAHVAEQHRIGHDVTLSGLYAALHQPGVQNVTMTSPATDLVMGEGEAAYCTDIVVTVAGNDV